MARLVKIVCTRTEAAQLLAYLDHRDYGADGGWYFGKRTDFQRRHESLREILERVIGESHPSTPGSPPSEKP